MTDVLAIRQQVLDLMPVVDDPWKGSRPRGASAEEMDAFSTKTGIALPSELREWLSLYNGSDIGQGGTYGIGSGRKYFKIESTLELKPEWKERLWLPVAGDGCGDDYVLDYTAGSPDQHPIYFIDHEDETTYIVASGLWQFLYFVIQEHIESAKEAENESEDEEEYDTASHWPFDKEKVVAVDPDILNYRGVVPIPWELE